MSPLAMVAGEIALAQTASTMENTGAVETRRIAAAGLPRAAITEAGVGFTLVATGAEATEAAQTPRQLP